MNRFFLRTSAIAVVIAICSSTSWADNRRDNRGDGRRQQQRTEQRSSGNRQGAVKRDVKNDSKRGDNHFSGSQRHEDKNKNHNKNQGLGTRPAPGQRPGAGQPAAPDRWERNKPKPQSPAHRPATPHRPAQPVPSHPSHAHKPAPRPSNFHGGFTPHPPHAPFHVHAPRPVPHRPAAWRPVGRPISFGQALLGLALGTAFNMSLEYLYDNGYTVGGYGNDAIYLNNVRMMDYVWPEASMFYDGGRLMSAVYTFASTYDNASRYNNLLNMLSVNYGAPYVTPTARGMSSTWWNGDGSYVTLNYESSYGTGGLRYYTTLTFGN